MNPVVMLCYNRTPKQLELSKLAVESVLAQDIPVTLFLIDNGSTAPTWEWMRSIESENVIIRSHEHNISPVKVCNDWMEELFDRRECAHLLGLPNDVILPPNLYREFLRWPRGIVCGSMTGEREFPRFEQSSAVNSCTPMAVALVRKWAYDALVAKDGYFFDPNFFMYASDCCLALRMAACGIVGVQLDIQYYHYCSASHRLAPPNRISSMAYGADKDRAYFEKKYGFKVDSPRYTECALDLNFRAEAV